MRTDDQDTRQMWHHIRQFVFDNIRKVARAAVFLVLLFILLHLVHPASIEWLGERIDFAKPSLPSALALALVIILVERVFIIEQIVRIPFVRLYATQERMYRDLSGVVEKDGAKEATFIQYSCNTCMPLVRALLASDARVTVYMQQPGIAGLIGSGLQKRRIEAHIETLPSEVGDALSLLTATMYAAPASVAAVRIDQDIIAIGWYIYLHVDESNQRHVRAGDKVKILAHDVPCVVARRGSAEYEILNRFFDRLEHNYKVNGVAVCLTGEPVEIDNEPPNTGVAPDG